MRESDFYPILDETECLCGACPECEIRELWDSKSMKPWKRTFTEKCTINLEEHFPELRSAPTL